MMFAVRRDLTLSVCVRRDAASGTATRPPDSGSRVPSPLIASGKLQNVQLDGELKTPGLHLLLFFRCFVPSPENSHVSNLRSLQASFITLCF